MASTARQDMITSAIHLFRERGIDGTAFSDVLEHSGAPRGSIYHHFPGGKAQLVREATETAGQLTADAIDVFARGTAAPGEVLAGFAGAWRTLLAESDFQAGCPIAAAAVSSHDVEGGSAVAGAAFVSWQAALERAFGGYGLSAARAASLAALVLASVEGAILLCRSTRTLDPLDRVVAELQLVLAAALPTR